MKIDNDSYYIRYRVNKGTEYADMTHYIKVWWNGEREDCFNFRRGYIGFEDASWNGIDPDKIQVGKPIQKQKYSMWKRRVTICKKKIEKMAKQNSSPFGGKLSVGDRLYFPLREILIAEYLDEFGEDITKEIGPYPYYSLVHVTNTEPEPQGTKVNVERYRTENYIESKSLINLMEDIEKAFIIPREVYDYAANLINKVSLEIMEEIKKEYYA